MRANSIKTGSASKALLGRLDRRGYFADVSVRAAFDQASRAATKPASVLTSVKSAPAVASIRTSQVLRELLTRNPSVKNFTVRQIVDSIGESRAGSSLMLFSIPGMLPVPGTTKLVGLPTPLIAGQMIADKPANRLPQFILDRSVPRRSLSVAIHAILPVLEMAEKVTKPRWEWLSDPAARRVLGVFIFVLALVIAVPFVGFNLPHAASIFMISLGLAEHDGLAILIGVTAGLAAVWLTGSSIVRFMASGWMKKIMQKAGVKWAAKVGLKWAGRLLKKLGSKWSTVFLLDWAERFLTRDDAKSSRLKRKRSASRRGQKRPAAHHRHLVGHAELARG
jgi:hypothetical protein